MIQTNQKLKRQLFVCGLFSLYIDSQVLRGLRKNDIIESARN